MTIDIQKGKIESLFHKTFRWNILKGKLGLSLLFSDIATVEVEKATTVEEEKKFTKSPMESQGRNDLC